MKKLHDKPDHIRRYPRIEKSKPKETMSQAESKEKSV